MALVSSTEIRPTDITTFVEFSPLAAGVTLPTSTAAGFRCFYTGTHPVKIMAMSVVTGSVTVGGVTFTAAFDSRVIDGTVTPVTVLNTVLATTAVTAVASKENVCPIDAGSDGLSVTVPANTWVGFNIPSTATNAGSVCGVLITYRPV